MKHQLHYDRLIARARSRAKPEGYVERHHVLPRALGGSDDQSNLVWLTAREHFVAHELLAHIYGGKMWYALWRMAQAGRVHSRNYEWIRTAHSRAITGRTLPASVREAMSRSRKGRKPTAEAVAARAAGLKGHTVSEETRKKISGKLSHLRRPVRQVGGQQYVSVNEAARQTGLSRQNIRHALNGRSSHAGGFQWEYV